MRLAFLFLGACSPMPQPHHGHDLMSFVPAQVGVCGALPTSAGERVTPQHCNPPNIIRCDDWRDLCWIADVQRKRLAVIRMPLAGEPVAITLPTGDEGRATVISTSAVWRAAWLDWPCLRGDSGGVAWGADGSAVCMLTACDVRTQRTWCAELSR